MGALKSKLPSVLVGLCAAALLVTETVLLRRGQMQARKACAALQVKKEERERLLRQSPAPSLENEKAIKTALEEAERTLAALRAEFGAGQTSGAVPAGPVEAFFDLRRFADAMRQKAVEARIAVKPTERFGFASYASAGPGAPLLPAVHRQRAMAVGVVEALIGARPIALLAVRREPPATTVDDASGRSVEDYFTLPRVHSLRQGGVVDTEAFRVEFTGQTAVLREFLNALAAAQQAVVVRTVEVEPLKSAPPGSSQAGDEAETLHRPQLSKFTVTLEIPLPANPPPPS